MPITAAAFDAAVPTALAKLGDSERSDNGGSEDSTLAQEVRSAVPASRCRSCEDRCHVPEHEVVGFVAQALRRHLAELEGHLERELTLDLQRFLQAHDDDCSPPSASAAAVSAAAAAAGAAKALVLSQPLVPPLSAPCHRFSALSVSPHPPPSGGCEARCGGSPPPAHASVAARSSLESHRDGCLDASHLTTQLDLTLPGVLDQSCLVSSCPLSLARVEKHTECQRSNCGRSDDVVSQAGGITGVVPSNLGTSQVSRPSLYEKSSSNHSHMNTMTTMNTLVWTKVLSENSDLQCETPWRDSNTMVMMAPRNRVISRVVRSNQFDMCISGFIVLNAVSIGLQTEYMAGHVTESVPIVYRVAELTFCVVFSCEVALRLYVHRLSFFMMNCWKWNCFDLTLVSLQLCEECLAAINSASSIQLSSMRMLRVLRILRVVRVFRLLRFIGELRTIVTSIAGSMRALLWTVVLLFLVEYVLGVYLTQVVSDYHINLPDDIEPDPNMALFYGSLLRSILSLYQAMSGGIDWDDLSKPLVDNVSPLLGFMFAIYIAFAVLAMMNVVTGVFVESALLRAKEDRDEYLAKDMIKVLRDATHSERGILRAEQFLPENAGVELMQAFTALNIDIQEIYKLFPTLVRDGEDSISIDSFVQRIFRLREPLKAIDLAALTYSTERMADQYATHAPVIESLIQELHGKLRATGLQQGCGSFAQDGWTADRAARLPLREFPEQPDAAAAAALWGQGLPLSLPNGAVAVEPIPGGDRVGHGGSGGVGPRSSSYGGATPSEAGTRSMESV